MSLDPVIRWDAGILTIFHDWRNPYLDGFFAGVTWFGSLWLLAPLSFVAAIAIWRGERGPVVPRRALYLPASLASASLMAFALKDLFDRFRPDLFEPLTVLPVDASFPSAHAAQITAFALAAWFLLSRSKRILFAPLLLTLVVAVAFSRLYLQVHWPSDVIVGVALGLLCASAVQFTFFTRNPL